MLYFTILIYTISIILIELTNKMNKATINDVNYRSNNVL